MSPVDAIARGPLIAAHRGTGLGAVAENTDLAIIAAARQGAEIVEVDVVESADGEFYLFHDGYEAQHFENAVALSTLSAHEIDALRYERQLTGPRAYGPTSLRTALRRCPEQTTLCLDRSWGSWPRLLTWLDGTPCPGRLQLKAPVRDGLLDLLADHRAAPPLVAIARSTWDVDRVLAARPEVAVDAVELVTANPDHPFASAEYIAGVQAAGVRVWLNAITLENGKDLFCGWDDLTSLTIGPDHGWGRLMALGADIIQTDWPDLLRTYRDSPRPG